MLTTWRIVAVSKNREIGLAFTRRATTVLLSLCYRFRIHALRALGAGEPRVADMMLFPGKSDGQSRQSSRGGQSRKPLYVLIARIASQAAVFA
jgi:hypothetical protein